MEVVLELGNAIRYDDCMSVAKRNAGLTIARLIIYVIWFGGCALAVLSGAQTVVSGLLYRDPELSGESQPSEQVVIEVANYRRDEVTKGLSYIIVGLSLSLILANRQLEREGAAGLDSSLGQEDRET